jgi:membrane-bound lytic murein transglycosylase A
MGIVKWNGFWGLTGVVLLGTALPAIPQAKPEVQSQSAKASKPLVVVQLSDRPGMDEQIWGQGKRSSDRRALLTAIDHSLRYLQTARAAKDYRRYSMAAGITRQRVERSLQRFRQLLLYARSPAEFQAAIEREFTFYQATGKDGQGTVVFTGYFEPVHLASRSPDRQFRYPIYRQPPDLTSWKHPHPTRSQLEGLDGLQFSQGKLRGLELVWLRDRLEAYLIQVQGSARLHLSDGTTMTVGYAGHTNYPYTSLGKELVKAGKIRQEELSLSAVIQYFQNNPADLDVYLPRNQRFVFFKETGGMPATGSLGVPVTPERSIATDKSLFPPGALALIQTQIPYPNEAGQLAQHPVTRYVLDQDTGGAIQGPGRVDIFMGTGKVAGDRAGLINSAGKLYYLLLK